MRLDDEFSHGSPAVHVPGSAYATRGVVFQTEPALLASLKRLLGPFTVAPSPSKPIVHVVIPLRYQARCPFSDRQYAADPAQRPSERTGCEILGKAEFMNPGQSVKDRAALYIVKVALNRGLLRPRRYGGRRHRRQHRDRHRRRRQRARVEIADRDSRDAKPGEEGCPAAPRRPADRGAGRSLPGPEQLREGLGAHGERAREGRSRRRRSGPTSSTMSPTGRRIRKPRAPKSGSRPKA